MVCLAVLMSGCKKSLPSEMDMLSAIQQETDLVTTELTIRKIAIYDSSRHEHIDITDPSTWKVGERKCIVPVEVKVKYGYDLREMTMESIKIEDEKHIVLINLPDSKIIDSSYETDVNDDEVVGISTGFRDEIGHETVEKIRQQAYEEIMKEDFEQIVGKEIRYNTETMLNSLVRSWGFEGAEFI